MSFYTLPYSFVGEGHNKRARQNATSMGMEEVMGEVCPIGGTSGTATNVNQVFTKKFRKHGHHKKSQLAKMLQLFKATQNYIIGRWQALTTFNTASAALLLSNDYETNGGGAGKPQLNFPMYCWNLSAIPLNRINAAGAVTISTQPCYRLVKNFAPTESYAWNQIAQVAGGESGTSANYNWAVEYDAIDAAPVLEVTRYSFDWAQAKFVFKGAGKRPVKIHMAMCRFENNAAGPSRNYVKSGVQNTWDPAPSADQVNDANSYWDTFWANKIGNPIRSFKLPDQYRLRKPTHMWGYESFVLGEDVSINNDPLPLQMVASKFMRFDKLMRSVDTNILQVKRNAGVGDTTGGAIGAFPGYDAVPADPTQGIATLTTPYGPYEKDIYLIVWADVYDQIKDGAGPGGTTATDICPSLDIVLRCKYSYND